MARDKAERIRHGEIKPKAYGTRRPFATIPTTVLATKRIRSLPGSAVRLLLWMEAGWHPARGVVVPQRKAAEDLAVRRDTVRKAIACLLKAGLAVLKAPAIKPTMMGGGTGPGRAAIYDLPHRHTGSGIRFEAGDVRLPGYLKLWCDDLRGLAGRLSDVAARVLLIVAAVPRASDGALLHEDAAIDLTGGRLARDLPRLIERTARRAVIELASTGLVKMVRPHAGTRGARYQPAGVLLTRIPRRRHS